MTETETTRTVPRASDIATDQLPSTQTVSLKDGIVL